VKLILGMFDDVRGMPRVVVPGEAIVELDAGERVIYGETASVVDGRAYRASSFSVRCSVTDAETGAPVALETRLATSTYSFGSFEGHSLFDVTIPHRGRYRIACDGDSPAVLAIGGGFVGSILIALGVGFGGFLLGGVVAALIAHRRWKAGRVPHPAR
jgi:hypothetical protein